MSSVREYKQPNKPRFTLFIPWTRHEYADEVLGSINAMYLPKDEMEIVFYVDTDDKKVWDRLDVWCQLNQFVWNGVRMVRSDNPAPENYSPIPRRARIVQMKEDSKQFIADSEFLFGLEDDTIAQPDAFERLFDPFTKQDDIGYVQGVQQGRWGMTVLGAWRVDDINDPQNVQTIPFEHDTDVVEVDGGGMFCYITPTELAKKHRYYWHDECFGPDMTYGLELRKLGYKCLTDFGVICQHLTEQGILFPSPQNTDVVKWRKVGAQWLNDHTSPI